MKTVLGMKITDRRICQVYLLMEKGTLAGPAHDTIMETTGFPRDVIGAALDDAEIRGLIETRGLPQGFGGLTAAGRDVLREWYIVETKPDKKMQAVKIAVELEKLGFTAWCPECVEKKIRWKKPTDVRGPLFPGIIFVERIDGMKRSNLFKPNGVANLMASASGIEYRIPNTEMEVLRLKIDEDGGALQITREEKKLQFSRDEKVVVLSLPNAPVGTVANLYTVSPGERITLWLDMMGQKVPLSVPAGDVQRLKKEDDSCASNGKSPDAPKKSHEKSKTSAPRGDGDSSSAGHHRVMGATA